QGRKVYRAQVRLGSCTNTYDAAGEVMAQRPVPALGPAEIEAALKPFRGRIEQVPPPFSAIRRDGRRFYERARAGDLTPPPARQVQILSLEMISWQSPELVLQVCCGSGTYIRSLAHDLGQNLGCGAHLQGLQRLQVGPFLLEQALSPDELPRCRQDWAGLLLPLDFPLQHWPSHRLSMEQVNWALNGRRLSLPPPNTGQNWARAHDPRGRFLALLCFDVQEENWHPARVFPPLES
ncbi:MAG: tRNA pseudouridine(55) synthase TruB, partial [Chloroflexia bacterium]|nr:tRNA pseudouridine(55) synthase TruB [Chloroflexia bacterium]